MSEVTFYHSVICPRCQLSKLALASVLKEFPQVKLRKVEFLTHMAEAKEAGASSIPALVSGNKVLLGVVLTPGKLRRFFAGLQPTE